MCNQNIRFVFCDFRREAEIAKNKTGPGPSGVDTKEKIFDFGLSVGGKHAKNQKKNKKQYKKTKKQKNKVS